MPTIFAPIEIGSLRWNFSRTLVMGVVNVTPDSFFDGGRYQDTAAAVDHALEMVEAGADVVDIGGESTRPGSERISADEELSRIIPVIEGIASRCQAPISVDTYKARVATEAVEAGASVINDVSGLQMDQEMVLAVKHSGAMVVLGHLRGRPERMQEEISFADVTQEVGDELHQCVRRAIFAGVPSERIWIDPGVGFGKTASQSLKLMRATGTLRDDVGCPVLVGPSRKSFIGAVTGQPPEERLMGTCAAVAAVVMAGADAVRVHDVAQLRPAIQVADAIHRGQE